MADVDVLIVGAGLGGVAAALAAANAGKSTILVERSQWVGGQITAQGVCTPDETGVNHKSVVTGGTGATRTYQGFREWIYNDYLAKGMQPKPADTVDYSGAPGNNWTSEDGFGTEANLARNVLMTMLSQAGVDLRLGATVGNPQMNGGAVASIDLTNANGSIETLNPKYVIDSTETGDLLPLLGLQYRIGAEASGFQGEQSNQPTDEPTWVQPITVPFAAEFHVGATTPTMNEPPPGYSPVGLSLFDGQISTMTKPVIGFTTYRRVIDHTMFPASSFPRDVFMVNVAGNDYDGAVYPSGDDATDQQIYEAARLMSLRYLYYLQHEAPREDGGKGWPEIQPSANYFDNDFIAPQPYVREARRIAAKGYVVMQDIMGPQTGPITQRATLFADSCGLGNYAMDVHSNRSDKCYYRTNPFQIRTSMLVPVDCPNLLAGGKCLGATHITNGAFRLHPQEWNTGESAAVLAAFCIDTGSAPADVCDSPDLLRAYQSRLFARGIPIFWWTDVPVSHPQFAAIQAVGVNNIFTGFPGTLDFRPNDAFTPTQQEAMNERFNEELPWQQGFTTRAGAAQILSDALNLLPG